MDATPNAPAPHDATSAPDASLTPPLDSIEIAPTPDPRTYKLTPEAQTIALLAAIEGGQGVREACAELSINIRTAYGILARSDDQLDTTRAAIRKLMQAQALERMHDWEAASVIGATKKGNHAPARDWLLHAGVIDPIAGENNLNLRVAIQIGTEEKPMRIQSPQVIDIEDVPE